MTIAYMAGAQDTQAEIGKLRAQHHTDQNLIDAANASAQRAIAERDALRAANKDLQDWYDAAITDASSVMHYRCGMAAYKVTLYSPKSYAPHWGIDCK